MVSKYLFTSNSPIFRESRGDENQQMQSVLLFTQTQQIKALNDTNHRFNEHLTITNQNPFPLVLI